MPQQPQTDGTPDQIDAIVWTESGPIPLSDFAEFFQLLRTAYSAALESMVSSGIAKDRPFEDLTMQLAALTRNHLDSLTRSEIERLGVRPLSVEPSIIRIHRDNPLDIVFGGLAILFAVAVVISGGKFEVSDKGLKVELPPLGDGIKKLRDALKRSGKRG